MTEHEKLVIISTLSFCAKEYISEALMGMRENENAMQTANILLLTCAYINNYNEKEKE